MLVDCRILKSSYLNICSRKSAETSNWSLNSHQPPVRVAERAAFAGNQCPKAPDIVVWVARHGSTKHYLRLKSNSTLSRFNFIRWFALVNRFWKKKLVSILSSIPAQANTSHIIWLSTEWGSLPHWVKITLCLCVCVCASLFAMLWKKLHFYWSQGLHHQLLDPIVQQAAPGMLEKDLLSGMNSKLGASSKLGVIVTRKIVANIQLKQSWTLEQHSFFLSQSDWQTANGIPSLHTLNPFDFFSQRCAKQGPFHHTLTHLGNSWLFSIASKTTSKPDLEMQTNRKPGTL